MLSSHGLFTFYTLQIFGRDIGLGIHKGKTLNKSIMFFLKLSVSLIVEFVFKNNLLGIAVRNKQGFQKKDNLTFDFLQVFSYFIKLFYHFIKLLVLVLILLKQKQDKPLYLLII